jgi:predicted GTPase
LIKAHDIDEVVLAYTDLSYEEVMHKASIVLACGADFRLMGPKTTMLSSKKPVIAVCAVRTGAGKSTVSLRVCDVLKNWGKRVVVVRHPMPYGDLLKQTCQRFTAREDLKKYECTIEEREEYEPYLERGITVYSGIDHRKILGEAEREADLILWDGGNNDLPFYWPSIHIVVADPHRPGHELRYYPGEANLRMADIVVVNKVDTANKEDVEIVVKNIKMVNPRATIIKARSEIITDKPELIAGRRVLAVEDGPTLTHGGMTYGAAFLAAKRYHAKEIINPKPFAVGSIIDVFNQYPGLKVLPAMGYGEKQIKELQETINKSDCEVVIAGTPMDLGRTIKVNKPVVRLRYELKEIDIKLEDTLKSIKS